MQYAESMQRRKKSFLERYFERILINLTLTINNLHIRYEDETYPFQHPFSFGLCLDNLVLKSQKQAFGFDNIFATEPKYRSLRKV
jgi:hypothetical protein